MISGLLLVDKPAGLTSHDVVGRLRKILGQKEIGHTGTLDPFATGLMITVLGEATKLSDYLRDSFKSYEVGFRLGFTTDTLDITGVPQTRTEISVSPSAIEEAVGKLTGSFDWPVPHFSAVKRDGKKLCNEARAGRPMQAPTKTMAFSNLEILATSGDLVTVRLDCSSGSYIRTWVDQLGRLLNCGATATSLRRLTCAGYSLERALTLEQLQNLGPQCVETASFVTVEEALPDFPGVMVKDRDEELLVNGTVSYDLSRRLNPLQHEVFGTGRPVTLKVMSGRSGRLLSIIEVKPLEGLKVRRIFRELA